MEYWEYLEYLYFSDASSAFTFAVAPFLWLGSLFVARIKRPQIIKTVLFLNFAPRYPYTKISLPPWEEWKVIK